ncbi:4-amino-4-deoxy-L-arabinose-phospho-UDP flippase [Xenorhabdus sp. PB62.4]|nr:4-amino-4-deoxy-L-arabinose-phospho-UDP flippase [Xenorhabdus sp. PB62.4]
MVVQCYSSIGHRNDILAAIITIFAAEHCISYAQYKFCSSDSDWAIFISGKSGAKTLDRRFCDYVGNFIDEPELMKGYLWGIASALLVTLAQLLLKWGVARLPELSLSAHWLDIDWLWANHTPLLMIMAGLAGYALSMLCWFFTLKYLPLNKAYPIISLSYAFVYLMAALLPWFNETVSLLKTAGVAFILLGVWLISRPENT